MGSTKNSSISWYKMKMKSKGAQILSEGRTMIWRNA
jgi:hypothetical protein